MPFEAVRAFFMWCTIINVGLLIVASVLFATAGNWIHQMHSRWFPISREAFYVIIYAILAGYKTLFILFNLVPYIALVIVG